VGKVDVVVGKQADALIVSSIRVTSPFCASSLPSTVTAEPTVIDVKAMTVPAKVEPPSNPAELPTCQKTSHAEAPPSSATELPVFKVRDDPVWKM
jgi:hypothetical protein